MTDKTREFVAGGATCTRLTAMKMTSSPEVVVMEDGRTAGTERGTGVSRDILVHKYTREGGISASGHS